MAGFFKEMWRVMFPRKEKVIENPGVIGHYDCKPYHNFKYALIYANETEIFSTDKVEIYSRVYKNTTFVNVLVNDEDGFDITKYTFDDLKPQLREKGIEETKNTIVLVLFQHNNEATIAQCKKFCKSDKFNFQQACVYNPVKVQMDFYKPVPKFYKLFDIFCEDLYFDLAFIDDSRK